MNLEKLIEVVKTTPKITKEMYRSAVELLKEQKEEYTLEEYATLLYVIGGYEEVQGLSVYTGVRINDAMQNKLYCVAVENDKVLDNKIIAFKDKMMQRVAVLNKAIEKRFLVLNIGMSFVLFLILVYLVKVNPLVAIIPTLVPFVINYFFTLPKMKRNVLKNQMLQLRDELKVEELKVFEDKIY